MRCLCLRSCGSGVSGWHASGKAVVPAEKDPGLEDVTRAWTFRVVE